MTGRQRATAGALLLTAAMALGGGLFGAPSLPATAVQAAMAEWGSSRLGVAWSDDRARETTRAALARAVRGATWGLGAAGLLYVLGIATGAITEILPTLAGGLLLVPIALGDAAVTAVRDEMLLHGLMLRVVDPPRDRPGPRLAALGACALASVAWALGEGGDRGVPLTRLAFEGLAGASYGALWLLDRGAWLPVTAHGAFRFATRGATFPVAAATAWGGGIPWGGAVGDLFAGLEAVVVAAIVAVASVLAVARESRRQSPA